MEMRLEKKDSKMIYIGPTIKSTKLMTGLRHRFDPGTIDEKCPDPFDVLYVRFFEKKYWLLLELVVVYEIDRSLVQELENEFYAQSKGPSEPNRITFSNFKKSKMGKWLSVDDERKQDCIPLGGNQILNVWKRPFILEASTDYDKDFRKEWRNGELEYEGNNYGDTSDFFIIGSVEKLEK